MNRDKQITEVIFRVDNSKDWRGTVFALLPHEVSDLKGNVTTYQHIGQHSSADYMYCIAKSRLATEKECADLKNEMEGLGYNFQKVTRQSQKKYLKSYYEVRGTK